MFNQIFSLQRELNQKIGRDTVGEDEQQRHDWVFQYLYAAKVEAGELLDCFDRESLYLRIADKPNAKVELIDIMHFVVSACQLVGITADDIPFIEHTTRPVFNAAFALDRDLELITTKQIDWKWWSKSVKADPSRQFKAIFDVEKLRSDLIRVFVDMIDVAYRLEMNSSDILSIYKMKHSKNCKRQDDGYDVRFKTETDNEEIQDQIKTGLVEVAPGQSAPVDRPTCNLTEGMSNDLKMVAGIPIKIKTDGFSGEFHNTIDPSLKQLKSDGGSEGDPNLSEFKQPV